MTTFTADGQLRRVRTRRDVPATISRTKADGHEIRARPAQSCRSVIPAIDPAYYWSISVSASAMTSAAGSPLSEDPPTR